MGYYITPALLGSPKEQMLSYFIAFYTNQTINWGMAAALSAILLCGDADAVHGLCPLISGRPGSTGHARRANRGRLP
jgi:hypothetical protein